ncbi:hypothetical protein H6P81_010254 [Aristolochia fimbriata]|uniref:Uncharacterized protein n=1 Tax=Aristolochia fimbriata TaxID=158543 RepID=A0AAV7ENV1_ARIFI|nr:hypothetical protein H6P81_010254 [Aristolochia fimbriata]
MSQVAGHRRRSQVAGGHRSQVAGGRRRSQVEGRRRSQWWAPRHATWCAVVIWACCPGRRKFGPVNRVVAAGGGTANSNKEYRDTVVRCRALTESKMWNKRKLIFNWLPTPFKFCFKIFQFKPSQPSTIIISYKHIID